MPENFNQFLFYIKNLIDEEQLENLVEKAQQQAGETEEKVLYA